MSDIKDAESGRVEIVSIRAGDHAYPASLRGRMNGNAPEAVDALGDLRILDRPRLALFCSGKCPGRLILRAYDLAHRLRERGFAIAGGFHTPMEQECLKVLLKGPAPIILCPAHGIARARLPVEYRKPLDEGRLLILSPFTEKDRRSTADTALLRNRFVVALSDRLLAVHAVPGSKTERLCAESLALGIPVLTIEDEANANLLAMGAVDAGHDGVLGEGPDSLHREVEWMS